MSIPSSDATDTELEHYAELGRQVLLSGLLEHVEDGVFLIDVLTGAALEANDAACILLALEYADVIGRAVWECSAQWSDEAGWRAWCALDEQEAVRSFSSLRRTDGTTLPVDVRLKRIANGEREFLGLIVRDATDSRRMEMELGERERHYQNVIDNTVDGYFAIDSQRRFIEVNDSLCRMFEAPRDEWMGKTPLDFITADSRTELIQQMQRIESSDHRRYQLVGLRKSGSTFPILLNTTTIRDAAGMPSGSFGFITDISAVVDAQEAVPASEHELRSILDNLQDTYYQTDKEGCVIRISRSVKQLLGYEVDEFLGTVLAHHYCSPEDRDAFLVAMKANGGQIIGGESRLRHKDGHEVWVRTSARFLADAAGNYAGVEGTSRDNTPQRKIEEALRLAAKVFADSGEGIMISSAENRIVSVNRAFMQLTGYSEDEVIGRNPRLLASGHHSAEFFNQIWSSTQETGSWRGEAWTKRKNGEVFPGWLSISSVRDTSGVVTNYVALFSDISERKAVEAHIEYLAHHDPLTGLPNRVLFRDRFEQAIAYAERAHSHAAMLFIDLDHFKTINDSLGHPVGDELLCDAAKRLEACIRDTDTVSRQGGDEFIVALTDVSDAEAVGRVAEKMLNAISLPFVIQDHEVGMSCSVGIAMYPDDGDDFDDLMKKADTAMYHAKDAGRNAFRFHTEHMTADALERLNLQGRIRHGMDRREFLLYYQPLVELATGRIVGAEALARWQPPGEEMIPPARFIPVAEHSGLIVPLGEWVLREACEEIARLHKAGHRHMSIAVNLSSIQFRRGDIEETVIRALSESGIPPSSLELELTESIMLHDEESVLAAVRHLKSLGVRLAIDDFGTGYSSLSYLKRFAVDKLKIDQSFVRDLVTDPDDAAIVQAVIQMAKSLKLQVLAEGVETEAIAAELRELKCDLVQGYWFGRPMPAADFHRLLAERG